MYKRQKEYTKKKRCIFLKVERKFLIEVDYARDEIIKKNNSFYGFESVNKILINIEDIKNLNKKMISNQSKMGTLAAKIKDLKDLDNENIVKVITNENLNNDGFSEAKNFLRRSSEVANIYHHIGIYCYSTETLKKFVQLNQSKNEIENRLEQLRALDNNIEIKVALASSSPIGVDTKEDYLALKKIMEYKV